MSAKIKDSMQGKPWKIKKKNSQKVNGKNEKKQQRKY